MAEHDTRVRKHALREHYRILRDALSKQQRTVNSRKIWECFFETEWYRRSERIAFYLNFRSEVETLPYLEQVLRDGKRVAVPLCDTDDKSMDMYEISDCSMLARGAYGILAPDTARIQDCVSVSDWEREDIVLVPALAFDRQGYRLGYGAGYYDRFLSGKNLTPVGFAYSCCVCDRLPHEQTDQRVSCLITETGCEI